MEERDKLLQDADLDAGPGADIPTEVLEESTTAARQEENTHE